MNRRCVSVALLATAMSSIPGALPGAQPVSPPQAAASAPQLPQPEWRRRRIAFFRTVQAVRRGDPVAAKEFDRLLTTYEHAALTFTPLENLDYLGVFYLGKDGVEKCFQIVVLNQVLGWYDALRFASASGRSEIVNNLAFFKGPYLVSNTAPSLVAWGRDHPEELAREFAKGMALAERFRDTPKHDERWPQAFGLERLICADGGKCETPQELPRDKWPEAWAAAKQRLAAYYQIATPPTAAPGS